MLLPALKLGGDTQPYEFRALRWGYEANLLSNQATCGLESCRRLREVRCGSLMSDLQLFLLG